MFLNLTYLNNKERDELQECTDKLFSATPEEQILLQRRIDEIETHRRPLNVIGFDECMEFKAYLYDKYLKLMRSGRGNHAKQFELMMRQIDIRMASLKLEDAMRAKTDVNKPRNPYDRARPQLGDNRIVAKRMESQWAIPVDDDDDDDIVIRPKPTRRSETDK